MTKLTNTELVHLHINAIELHNQKLRLGQSYMIALGDINHDLYTEVTNTDNDCFYNDNKINNLLNFLTTNCK